MKQTKLNHYAQKWLLDSFYNSIANGKYTTSRISEEKVGNFHKRNTYKDLLSTMYTNKNKALGLNDSGFTIDEQIEAGYRDKEVLAAMYDNIKSARKLDKIGISYDMQANLGVKLGKAFQAFYNKTEEVVNFVEKNEIAPILLTGFLMQEGRPSYLLAENNPKATSAEINKLHNCNYFLKAAIPNMMAGMFAQSVNGNMAASLPEDIGRIIGEKLVSQSNGSKDFRTLVRLSEVNKGATEHMKSR
jgi:hypothetical protein